MPCPFLGAGLGAPGAGTRGSCPLGRLPVGRSSPITAPKSMHTKNQFMGSTVPAPRASATPTHRLACFQSVRVSLSCRLASQRPARALCPASVFLPTVPRAAGLSILQTEGEPCTHGSCGTGPERAHGYTARSTRQLPGDTEMNYMGWGRGGMHPVTQDVFCPKGCRLKERGRNSLPIVMVSVRQQVRWAQGQTRREVLLQGQS